jgi:hypothetical protein
MNARLLLVAALAIAAHAPCQLGKPLPSPALGSHVLDVQAVLSAATGVVVDGVLGVARDANGDYWVSARRAPRLPLSTPHMLYQLSAQGQYLGGVPQPAATSSSAWGMRDLAFDGQRYLYGGFEGDRVLAFDTQAGVFVPALDFVVPSGLTFSTMRALAYDPNGAGGAGSLWVANFTSEHVEFDRAGTILQRVPNLQPGAFGAAYDAARGTIWWFGQSGSTRANTKVVATEMDPQTTQVTGRRVLGDLSIQGTLFPGGFAGGVEIYDDGARHVLLTCAQGASDFLVELDATFDVGGSAGGETSFDGDACYVGNANFEVTLAASSSSSAVLIVGGAPTDFDLTMLGWAPGNRLYVDINQFHFPIGPSTVQSGEASIPLSIPNLAQLAGADLYLQWLELSPSGLATSSGGAIHILP